MKKRRRGAALVEYLMVCACTTAACAACADLLTEAYTAAFTQLAQQIAALVGGP